MMSIHCSFNSETLFCSDKCIYGGSEFDFAQTNYHCPRNYLILLNALYIWLKTCQEVNFFIGHESSKVVTNKWDVELII